MFRVKRCGSLDLMILFKLAVFILGLCVGSFLNVLIYRLPKNLGFVKGRSFCPKCKHKLSWFDNIPLLSFLFLKGKCRYCKKPISIRYPLVEVVTGLLTVLIFNFKFEILSQSSLFEYFNFQTLSDSVLSLLFFYGLVVIFFIDFEHQIIPDEIVIPLIFLYVIFNILNTKYLILNTKKLSIFAFPTMTFA